ncbi:diheme cytochrome c-553 [Hyalangium rubrum]|uniref:Diheme cytochrome c-553 n=1 Tax=Hyalangium rubrum TaxID=3103134 RepID=A0ABU5H0D3_9BACT|nr:diheme cytochrome c-553 [Hyalangium sp. s54d21]MDY7226913.1 diheme cytochrome c-553 [Hyalangium sp. s54d21]
MKSSRVLLLVSAVAVGVPVVAAAQAKPATKAPAKGNKQVQRGEYLVRIAGCHDCHTPMAMGPQGPAPDMTKALSGHPEGMQLPPAPAAQGPWIVAFAGTNTAMAGPWGVSYAANITSDKDTGMGAWTEQQFTQAMKTGKHMGAGRPILPPMPWQNLAAMTDEDLKSVFAYLKSTPPLKNKVPEPTPPAAGAGGPPGGAPAGGPPAPTPAPKK